MGYSQAGYGAQEIANEMLPRLTLDQVRAALRYYGMCPDEIDQRLASADPEVAKARLYRELGPTPYRQFTGQTTVPRLVKESRSTEEVLDTRRYPSDYR